MVEIHLVWHKQHGRCASRGAAKYSNEIDSKRLSIKHFLLFRWENIIKVRTNF